MSLKSDSEAPQNGYSGAVNVLPSFVSAITATVAVGAVVVDHGIHRRSSQFFDRSVYHGPGDRQSVALTFDDGPGPQTLELLAYLAEERIPATFFQCGMHVQRYPEITRAVLAGGHEIGNHAWSHVQLSPHFGRRLHFPSPRVMYRELAQTQRLLREVCGLTPRLFRPPYGKRWVALDAVQRRLGLLNVHWSVIGHDWEWPGERVAAHVLERCAPGAIVCLHDGRDVRQPCDITDTMAALRLIVPALREQGYGFETVSSLLVQSPDLVALPA